LTICSGRSALAVPAFVILAYMTRSIFCDSLTSRLHKTFV